jgi:hypothetical protein
MHTVRETLRTTRRCGWSYTANKDGGNCTQWYVGVGVGVGVTHKGEGERKRERKRKREALPGAYQGRRAMQEV